MDAGDAILAESTPVLADDTGQSLHDRLAELAPQALARALPLLERGTAPRIPQPPDHVTRCAKLSRTLARLDWSRPAVDLERLIRAYHPWPGTHTCLPANHGGRLLKIFPPARVVTLPANPDPAHPPRPGQLLAVHRDSILVATGRDALTLTTLQAEGQKRLPARDFLAGTRLEVGQMLGERAPD
jgi:methionyl-tRNA formyltransferase